MATTTETSANIFLRFHPVHRIIISLVAALSAYLFMRGGNMTPLVRLTYTWDAFALTLLLVSWIVFYSGPVSWIRQFARREDGSIFYVFLVVILASLSSMFALFQLFLSKEMASMGTYELLLAAVPAMLLAWATIHTTFAFHYAHIYYDDADEDRNHHAAGLEFPGEKKPDYLDFAYFSFVIGMTFQVSDVQVTSRRIRRLALLHGILSFALNTFVVALTINLIAGLKN